jgi:CPA1 family monovalent cation:H+ antiporter
VVLQLGWYGLIISFVTIVIRILWVLGGAYYQHIFLKKGGDDTSDSEPIAWKNVLIVAWTGTRGVVSLAAALALPLTLRNGATFPQRNVILLLTFIVILVTLVVQGLTLPLLVRVLKIKPEIRQQKQEEDDLQLTLTENTIQFIDHGFPLELDDKVLDQLKKQYGFSYSLLSKKNTGSGTEQRQYISQLNYINDLMSAQLEIIRFQRELLLKFHTEGTFNDETITKAERELDIEELRLNTMLERGKTQTK